MKNLTLFFLLPLLLMFSCKEDTDTAVDKKRTTDVNDLIIGRWSWFKSSGGIAGLLMTPATEGYTEMLEFTPDGAFNLYRNKNKEISTRYQIKKGKSIYSNKEEDIITFENKDISKTFTVTSGKLELYDQAYDAFYSIYNRAGGGL